MERHPCWFCGEMTSHNEFCSDLCYLDYCAAEAEIREQLEEEDFDDGEPLNIDSDFGYDPYAGGPEMDEPMDCYDSCYDQEY